MLYTRFQPENLKRRNLDRDISRGLCFGDVDCIKLADEITGSDTLQSQHVNKPSDVNVGTWVLMPYEHLG